MPTTTSSSSRTASLPMLRSRTHLRWSIRRSGWPRRPAAPRSSASRATTSRASRPCHRGGSAPSSTPGPTAPVELGARDDVAHVFCFENRGEEIGVTLHHPHGQIYAYPYLPATTAEILARAQAHHDETGRLLGADILAAERSAGDRVVLEGRHWTAYVPFAARWPARGAPGTAPGRPRPRRPRRRRARRAGRRLPRPARAPQPLPRRRRRCRRSCCPTSPPGTRPRRARAATCPGCSSR